MIFLDKCLDFWLTHEGNSDSLEKFAQNVTRCGVTLEVRVRFGQVRKVLVDRPGASAETKKQDTRAGSQTDEIYSAIKFEDTYPVSAGLVLDPKLPAQADQQHGSLTT